MEKNLNMEFDQQLLQYYALDAIARPLSQLSLYDYMDFNTQGHENKAAVSFYHNQYTIEEWKKMILTTARSYKKMGIQKGEFVPFAVFGCVEAWLSFYALNLIGAVVVPFDPRTDINGVVSILNEDKSRHLLMLDAAYSKIRNIADKTSLEKIIVVTPLDWMNKKEQLGYRYVQAIKKHDIKIPNDIGYVKWQEFMDHGKNYTEDLRETYSPHDVAAIIYTSGTTGPKKGVELTNQNINEVASMYHDSDVDFRPGDRFLNVMPPSIGYGVVFSHLAFSSAVENKIINFFNVNKFDQLLLENKDKRLHFAAAPGHVTSLINSKKLKNKDLSHVKTCAIGGAPCPAAKKNEMDRFLIEHNTEPAIMGYALTETGSAFATNVNNGNPKCNKPDRVGIPLPKNKVIVVDENKNILGRNEIGELLVSGPTIMKQYHHNEDETKKVLYNGYFCTGDIGFIDDDFSIAVTGRRKNMINRFDGHNVFPEEIDKIVSGHPAVKECATIGIPDYSKPIGELPKTFVVLNSEYRFQKAKIKRELQNLCLENLPERDVASYYEFVSKLPYNNSGKVDFFELKQEEQAKVKTKALQLTRNYMKK